MDQLAAERTTVVIAHRLATIRGADQIAVLQDGRVLEVGTHEELLAGEGLSAACSTGLSSDWSYLHFQHKVSQS